MLQKVCHCNNDMIYTYIHTSGVQYTKFSYHDIGDILSQYNICITTGAYKRHEVIK